MVRGRKYCSSIVGGLLSGMCGRGPFELEERSFEYEYRDILITGVVHLLVRVHRKGIQ